MQGVFNGDKEKSFVSIWVSLHEAHKIGKLLPYAVMFEIYLILCVIVYYAFKKIKIKLKKQSN